MIRIVLILLVLLIVWLLFVAKLEKNQRIIAVIVICLVFAVAVWFDDNRKRPKQHLLSTSDIVSCGLEADAPYRSNFDFSLCFQNVASKGTARRLMFDVQARICSSEPCEVVETVSREIPVLIPAGQMITVKQSLRFDSAAKKSSDMMWFVAVTGVKATPK